MLALLAAPLAVGCGSSADPGDDMPPGDDVPPDPTVLARCADPAKPITSAWEVDNIRAPLVAQTQLGSTILVTSGDGAVKTWDLPAAGGAPNAPHYGTPFVDEGVIVPALAAAPPGPVPAFVGLDAAGFAYLWGVDGSTLHDPIALVSSMGAFVAVDADLRWIAGGTDEFGGAMGVADLGTGELEGPLATEMWNVTDAEIGHGGKLVTVGHWYGCPAIELRDASDPTVVTAYWDGCRGDAAMLQGWLRAVALDPTATEAIAVGDGLFLRFDLANLAAGPTQVVQNDQRYDEVIWSAADELALTLGPAGETESTISVWSTVDHQVTRTTTVPAAIGLTVDADAGVLITARADGMVRGDRCSE